MPVTEARPLQPRQAAFDLSRTPLQWVPGEPYASHLGNALHLLLPAGERWFVRVYKQALPHLTDERLRQEAKGFMGQEATHAQAHTAALEYLRSHSVNPAPFLAEVEWTFRHRLADDAVRPDFRDGPRREREWLLERLGIVAAIEHFTAVLGHWALKSSGLERAGADPNMLGLLRWHGAEEVEHRSVAFDVFEHLGGSYRTRARMMLQVFPNMTALWSRAVDFLQSQDPHARRGLRLREHQRAAARELVPSLELLLGVVPSYLRRDFHPAQLGSTRRALDYLERSTGPRHFAPSNAEASP